MKKLFFFISVVLLVCACGSKEKKQEKTPANGQQQKEASAENSDDLWNEVYGSIAKIESFDGNRILEKGQGFFVGEDLLVTKYSLVNQATRVEVQPFNENKVYSASHYVAFDRINDLIVLQVDSIKKSPVKLFEGVAPNSAKTVCLTPKTGKTLQLFTGKLLNLANIRGTKQYRITNRIRSSQFGTPVLLSNQSALGVAYSGTVNYEMQSFAIPSMYIHNMLQKKKSPEALDMLTTASNAKVAAENMRIKGLVIETEMGNITIKLFNETPEYRDNFIRLVKENYYDSLLIHRVIKDFGIQSGAADTRYAEPKANVGWKGPGYTIPAHIVPGLFHQRGMIGSPRKPDTKNQRRRSDGSQFYIVSGRKYYDAELDDLEEQNSYKFSATQRKVYKSIGGSPHLDGTYTIFGKVTSGMDVVDKIVKVETDQRWRPVEDIRIKQIRILK